MEPGLPGSITINGQLLPGEFLRFNYWVMWRRFKGFVVLILFVSVVYPVLAYAGVLGPNAIAADGKQWVYFVWPLVLVLITVGIHFSAKRAFAANNLLSQSVRYTFSARGIEAVGALSSGNVAWVGVISGEETDSSFLLWLSKQQAYILPKRYFGDSQTLERFRNLLREQLGSRATLKSGA